MDVQIQFWSDELNKAVTRYWGSEFQLNTDAVTLKENLLKSLNPLPIEKQKLVWPIEKLLRAMFKFLKHSTARRAEYLWVSKGLWPEKLLLPNCVLTIPLMYNSFDKGTGNAISRLLGNTKVQKMFGALPLGPVGGGITSPPPPQNPPADLLAPRPTGATLAFAPEISLKFHQNYP